MKYFKRILSLILAVLVVLPTLVSCSSTENNTITTGEFYALFIEEAGLYYVSETPDEEDVGYDVEAQAMVDWGLMSEEDAFDNLYDVVTKETVITVCINNMYFVKDGDINSFKDAKLCNNPQLMANAVATGIVELENGYLDAKEKMSKEDCLTIINKSLEIDSNSHFEDGTGTIEYEYGEEYDFFSGDDIDPNEIEIYGYSNEQYSFDNSDSEKADETIEPVSNNVTPSVTPLSSAYSTIKATPLSMTNTRSNALNVTNLSVTTNSKPQITTLENNNKNTTVTPLADNFSEKFRVHIPKNVFEITMKNPKVGDQIIYMPWQGALAIQRYGQGNELLSKGFSGKLLSAKFMGLGYECEFERIDDEEIIKGMKIEKYGKTVKKDNLSHTLFKTNVDGFGIEFKKENNGYTVNVEKTFKVSQNEYNNWRDWKVEPKLTVSASITDFHLDCDNVKSIVSNSKKDKTLLSLSYKTNQDVTLEAGGLRLAPDSNRNGKFTSNISKSRFTSGAGAKYVKVGGIKIDIPEIGLSVPITVYLEVSVDGKINIVFDESKSIRLVKQNGNFKFANETVKDKTIELTGNIDAGLRMEIGLNFILMRKSLMVAYGKLGVNVTLYSKVYEGTELLNTGYADAEDLQHEHSVQKDMHFCLDMSGYVYAEIGLCEGASYGSFLADLLKALDVDINDLKARKQSKSVSLFHLEDGLSFKSNTVAKCSMGDKLEVNSEGEIELESYKESMLVKEQISLSVLSIPMKESKLEDNGGFKIKVKDKNVVRVEYDETLNVLNIYALNDGSTEIEIKIVKTKKTKKKKATYYKQEVSITVNTENDNSSIGGNGGGGGGGGAF